MEWQSQGRPDQHRAYPRGDASFPGRTRSATVHRALEKALDGLACAGWVSHWTGRLAGQLCRTAPGRTAGWNGDHRRHSQLPGEPPDEQIAADALVTTGCRSSAPGSLRRLQWDARLRLRTEIPTR